mmetsp:Transcript_15717/g.24880  ORF Transcript_15717/g.24880 Transcript_15717/m.24880 type:complete len:1235 (-) Transcript_15717:280-3984(-)
MGNCTLRKGKDNKPKLTGIPDIPIVKMPKTLDDFILLEHLQSSQYFESYRATLKDPTIHLQAIVKIVNPAHSRKFRRQVKKDKAMRRKVGDHPNILYSRWMGPDSKGRIWKARQFCKGGPVMRLRALSDGNLKEAYIAYIIHETLKGLQHLHRHNFQHTSVKPSNIMLTEHFDVKLTDPWVRVPLKHKQYRKGRHQTMIEFHNPLWTPPEGFKGGVDAKGDIWSLGLCALQLATGKVPDQGKPVWKIAWARVMAPAPKLKDTGAHKWSFEFRDFVSKCLTKDPKKRPSAKELLNHQFMDRENWNVIAGIMKGGSEKEDEEIPKYAEILARRGSNVTAEKLAICRIIKEKYEANTPPAERKERLRQKRLARKMSMSAQNGDMEKVEEKDFNEDVDSTFLWLEECLPHDYDVNNEIRAQIDEEENEGDQSRTETSGDEEILDSSKPKLAAIKSAPELDRPKSGQVMAGEIKFLEADKKLQVKFTPPNVNPLSKILGHKKKSRPRLDLGPPSDELELDFTPQAVSNASTAGGEFSFREMEKKTEKSNGTSRSTGKKWLKNKALTLDRSTAYDASEADPIRKPGRKKKVLIDVPPSPNLDQIFGKSSPHEGSNAKRVKRKSIGTRMPGLERGVSYALVRRPKDQTSEFITRRFKIGFDGLRVISAALAPGQKKKSRSSNSGELVGERFELGDMVDIRHLGQGASGYVSQEMYVPWLKLVACKHLRVDNQKLRHQIDKELTAFIKTQRGFHEGIVNLIGGYYREGFIVIVLEYMNMGSLRDCVEKFGVMPEACVAVLAKQLLTGLDYLHKQKILHRDIKPDNFLASSDGQVKLADFGLAQQTDENGFCKTKLGTIMYLSPELTQEQDASFPADVWAFGLSMYYCAVGKHPMPKNFWELIEHITTKEPPRLTSKFSGKFRDFVAKCLKRDPNKRATTSELLKHPFITNAPGRDILGKYFSSLKAKTAHKDAEKMLKSLMLKLSKDSESEQFQKLERLVQLAFNGVRRRSSTSSAMTAGGQSITSPTSANRQNSIRGAHSLSPLMEDDDEDDKQVNLDIKEETKLHGKSIPACEREAMAQLAELAEQLCITPGDLVDVLSKTYQEIRRGDLTDENFSVSADTRMDSQVVEDVKNLLIEEKARDLYDDEMSPDAEEMAVPFATARRSLNRRSLSRQNVNLRPLDEKRMKKTKSMPKMKELTHEELVAQDLSYAGCGCGVIFRPRNLPRSQSARPLPKPKKRM